VPVEARLSRGPTITALLDAARDAGLLLFGGRHTDDVRMSRLGWTASVLLAQAPCPVEVVGWPAAGAGAPAAESAGAGRRPHLAMAYGN
jgi:nucleotide-binding universal stress UspA family protein